VAQIVSNHGAEQLYGPLFNAIGFPFPISLSTDGFYSKIISIATSTDIASYTYAKKEREK